VSVTAPNGLSSDAPNGLSSGARRAPTHPALIVVPPAPVPEIPAGWEVAPPDFVGVGVQRSGTTWWWHVVQSHPDVAQAGDVATGLPGRDDVGGLVEDVYGTKELCFFHHYGQVDDVDPAQYSRYFPRPPGRIAGEWTPDYMYDFWTPPMLRQVAPETKILVLLRDPIERFSSGVKHEARLNKLFGVKENTQTLAYHEQFGRGLYWTQLQNVLKFFPKDQVLVLQHERCVVDMDEQARRTFTFLGLDAAKWRRPEELSPPADLAGPPKLAINDATKDALRAAYEPEVSRLLADFPEIDGSLWPTATGREAVSPL
jgi:Sulfotransferase domain